MSFNSLQFLIYLPIVLLVYFLLPHKVRWVWLLSASYYFYMSWNPWLVFLILATTIVSYVASILIERSQSPGRRKFYLAITIIVCLGILVFFKYFNFLVQSAIDFLNLFSLNIHSFALDLILPIGISFYTFQTLSYVIDVYRGDYQAEHHFGYFALFVSFFPQLVAGPIERPGDLLPQLKAEHHFNSENFLAGTKILLSGFFRKVVVADFLGLFVTTGFNNLAEANSLAVYLSCILFMIQIYCDFAGYSEIATGSARIMGIKLTTNFDRPYLATSFSEYFRRWHITLNRWFTYYLYIPLGGNRKGKARKILNTFIVFGLCGLWHGARWPYVLWGLYGALFVSIESLIRKPFFNYCKTHHINLDNLGIKTFRRIYTFILLSLSAVLFRCEDFTSIGIAYSKLFTGFGGDFFLDAASLLGLTWSNCLLIILMLVSMCLIYYFANSTPKIHTQIKEGDMTAIEVKKSSYIGHELITIFIITATIAICWISLLSISGESAFAYFQF